MRYTVYSLMFFIISFKSYTQFSVECVVELEEKNDLKAVIKIYNKDEGFIDEALEGEVFLIESEKSTATFIFIANDYSLIEKEIDFNDVNNLKIVIPRRLEKLNEIVLNAKKKDVFALKRMKDFEKTAIYAGKKTEVILDFITNKNVLNSLYDIMFRF